MDKPYLEYYSVITRARRVNISTPGYFSTKIQSIAERKRTSAVERTRPVYAESTHLISPSGAFYGKISRDERRLLSYWHKRIRTRCFGQGQASRRPGAVYAKLLWPA